MVEAWDSRPADKSAQGLGGFSARESELGTATGLGRISSAAAFSVNFVLDTNAVSETRKPQPNRGLIGWRDAQDRGHLFITTITVAEVWHGYHRLSPNHVDREEIRRFADNLPRNYRVLNFDLRAAAIWGELTSGKDPLPLRDSYIGAIARSRGYHVVTRDVQPFERMGCKVLNPWD